jgi:hypothetical protein
VWRGVLDEDGTQITVAVGLVDGRMVAKLWCMSKWRDMGGDFAERALGAAFIAERARAEKAEAVTNAERALRCAVAAFACGAPGAGERLNAADAALRALGVDL